MYVSVDEKVQIKGQPFPRTLRDLIEEQVTGVPSVFLEPSDPRGKLTGGLVRGIDGQMKQV